MNSETAGYHSVQSLWERLWCVLFLFFLITFLSGCASIWPGRERLPLHRELQPLPASCRIAVLPFVNDSDYPLGGLLAQKVFAAELYRSAAPVLIQDGDVAKTYQQLHLLPGDTPTLEQLQIIADRVDAQLLLTGIVMDMREDRLGSDTVNPELILQVQLRDPRSGETLWTTFHRRKGTDYKKTMHFGTLHTLTGLCRQMAEEIFNLWLKKGFAPCDG